jgi:organic hydroperoxide reductase OsmC/OhrA
VPARPKVLEFDVTVAEDGSARSGLGGSPLAAEDAWKAEHLVLAGLVRCTLASLDYHVRRADLDARGSGRAHGLVTQREDDGLYAFVEIDTALEVELEPPPGADAARELVAKAERGCFVANSLRVKPRYRWTVNGEEIA